MITCVQKDTHTKKIDRPNRIGKFVPRMSNRIKFVNCSVWDAIQNVILNSETKSKFFSKNFIMSGKYGSKSTIVILWSTLFRREITRVPKRSGQQQNTRIPKLRRHLGRKREDTSDVYTALISGSPGLSGGTFLSFFVMATSR